MFYIAYAAVLAVGIETLVVGLLCAKLVAELASRGREVNHGSNQVSVLVSRFNTSNGKFGVRLVDAIRFNILSQCMAIDTLQTGINESALIKFGHQAHHAASATKLLNAILLAVGGQFHEEGCLARESVDIVHREVNPSLLGNGEQMEHGVGGGSHGYIHCHGVEECLTGGYAARQHTLVAILVIGQRVLHNQAGCLLHQALTVLMGSQYSAVARQRETDGLCQVVHRVGGEHSRTAAAARTSAVLNLLKVGIADGGVATFNHGDDKVKVLALVLPGFHGTTAHENGGDVQAHGCHQHARGNLVAVRDANHGISLVAVDHIFHRVGNDVARGQRIEHSVVAHGNAVVDGDGVELSGIAAKSFYFFFNDLSSLVQMSMSGHKLGKRVYNGNNRFAKLLALHAIGHPQCTGTSHSPSFGAYCTA